MRVKATTAHRRPGQKASSGLPADVPLPSVTLSDFDLVVVIFFVYSISAASLQHFRPACMSTVIKVRYLGFVPRRRLSKP